MLIEKIILGITLSAPIGPVSLEMIKRGLNKGFFAALIIRLGGMIGNTLCLIAAYFGVGLFVHSDSALAMCSLVGSLVLIYMGLKTFLNKKTLQLNNQTDSISYNLLNGLFTGFILSVANPIGIIFWLSIFAATIDTNAQSQSLMGLFQNFGIILGVLLWGICLSSILELGKRFINQKFVNVITLLAGAMLIFFGLKYGYKATVLLS